MFKQFIENYTNPNLPSSLKEKVDLLCGLQQDFPCYQTLPSFLSLQKENFERLVNKVSWDEVIRELDTQWKDVELIKKAYDHAPAKYHKKSLSYHIYVLMTLPVVELADKDYRRFFCALPLEVQKELSGKLKGRRFTT